MLKFKLELFLQILGIGSASGLVYKNNDLYIISDNAAVIYQYNLNSKKLNSHVLLEKEKLTTTENIPKSSKPDFESITSFGEDCYIFGSGSTENRQKMIHFDVSKNQVIQQTDVSALYDAMKNFAQIDAQNFNIEGAVYTGDNWFLFNRGNGNLNQNGIFTIGGKNLEEEFSVLYNAYKLPKIKKVRSSFTDAVRLDNKIYFLATVEDSQSTYADGKILGSFIGRLDIQKMKIDFTQKISNTQKFEGLTLYKETANELQFLLCEDNDTGTLTSNIYRLTFNKK